MADRTRARSRRRDRTATVDALVEAAAASTRQGTSPPDPALVERLARGPAGPGDGGDRDGDDPVDRALAAALVDAVAAAWQRGWQPADLHRAVERRLGRGPARVAVRAVAHEAGRHRDVDVPVRWRLQLDAIGAAGADGADAAGERWAVPWPPALGPDGRPGAARVQAVDAAVAALGLLRALPRLPRLGPLPGEARPSHGGAVRGARRRAADAPGADPRVLRKVTSLLAKAESTNFPDEAEALTAKAQQLMTRHAIDRAHLDAGRDEAPRVGGRRIGVDDPYAGARYLLLAAVAEANRCRAVWTRQWWFATVFGDEGDLDTVEMLFTSLLVQATRAMVAEPRPPGRSTAGGTRSFRQSFLVAFAGRVGERLAQAAEQVVADESTRSTALVPVFAARREAADAAVAAAFPDLRTTRMTARNAAGWQAGTRAADRAQLDLHRPVRPGGVAALR